MILLFSTLLLASYGPSGRNDKSNNANKSISHSEWDSLLKAHVSDVGKVNYYGFFTDKDKLNAYLAKLSLGVNEDTWGEEEKLAYWINVYNSFTIKLIVDNYPVKSINDIGSWYQPVWFTSFIKIDGKSYSLWDIEHNIIRAQFNEPRIHFAIVCASESCPALLNVAYKGESLDTQLHNQLKRFLSDVTKNIIKKDKVLLSEIFNWFEDDFLNAGGVRKYVNSYSKVKIADDVDIEYFEYNWNLNEWSLGNGTYTGNN